MLNQRRQEDRKGGRDNEDKLRELEAIANGCGTETDK